MKKGEKKRGKLVLFVQDNVLFWGGCNIISFQINFSVIILFLSFFTIYLIKNTFCIDPFLIKCRIVFAIYYAI